MGVDRSEGQRRQDQLLAVSTVASFSSTLLIREKHEEQSQWDVLWLLGCTLEWVGYSCLDASRDLLLTMPQASKSEVSGKALTNRLLPDKEPGIFRSSSYSKKEMFPGDQNVFDLLLMEWCADSYQLQQTDIVATVRDLDRKALLLSISAKMKDYQAKYSKFFDSFRIRTDN